WLRCYGLFPIAALNRWCGRRTTIRFAHRSLAAPCSAMLPSALMMRWLQITRRAFLPASTCVFGILLLAASSAGQRDRPVGQATSPALRQAISDAAKKYKIPGIAAALIDHGQLEAIEVLGVGAKKPTLPVTANTMFEAGSLGEPLYAYAVLLLSANGQFNPGAPLPSYLPLPYLRDLDPTSASSATESLYDPQF